MLSVLPEALRLNEGCVRPKGYQRHNRCHSLSIDKKVRSQWRSLPTPSRMDTAIKDPWVVGVPDVDVRRQSREGQRAGEKLNWENTGSSKAATKEQDNKGENWVPVGKE